MSRVYVTAGTGAGGIKLWSVHQVGPVYFNDLRIGDTAKNEYLVVDVKPGTYESSCAPSDPEKNYAEKTNLTFQADQTYYLACDMESTSGMALGLVGYLASNYVSMTRLVERPGPDPEAKVVSYKKLELQPIWGDRVGSAKAGANASSATGISRGDSLSSKQETGLPISSTALTEKLRELQRLHDENLITDKDYERKKAQLLNAYYSGVAK